MNTCPPSFAAVKREWRNVVSPKLLSPKLLNPEAYREGFAAVYAVEYRLKFIDREDEVFGYIGAACTRTQTMKALVERCSAHGSDLKRASKPGYERLYVEDLLWACTSIEIQFKIIELVDPKDYKERENFWGQACTQGFGTRMLTNHGKRARYTALVAR